MLCDLCRQNEATIHLTEIVNDKIVEMHICQSCAQEKTENLNEQLKLSGFLGGLAGPSGQKNKKEIQMCCSLCGLNFNEFKRKGTVGCGGCYSVFRSQLLPLLKKIHGSTRHTGKQPQHVDRGASLEMEIGELRKRLERAIHLEEYEEAARLRDEIRKLETK